MRIGHLQDALALVHQLKATLLDSRAFHGYSGPMWAVSGTIALVAAAVMWSDFFPDTKPAYAMGWGTVFLVAFVLNGAAVGYWSLHDKGVKRDPNRLRPIVDVIPPMAVGALLTGVAIYRGDPGYLYGIWMCMFGLTNLASRYVLPWPIGLVGVFYVICGTLVLLLGMPFLNPWPMGVVFFLGEWASGAILYMDRRRYAAFAAYVDRLNETAPEKGQMGDVSDDTDQ